MTLGQIGIFETGASTHAFLELDMVAPGHDPLGALTGLDLTGIVVGVRPELWPNASAAGFNEPIVGPDGFTMPATQHDLWLWVAGDSRPAVFDRATELVTELRPVATVRAAIDGWCYRDSLDLTGFEDGTENPTPDEAPEVALAADGSSVVLFQKWRHDSQLWRSLAVEQQEDVIGRTKAGSVELDESRMPADSHVSRNVIEVNGSELEIYRRNVAWGSVLEHGTVFIGFCSAQSTLVSMLTRMAGVGDGIRDALTRYSTPLTGAYYVVPSQQDLEELKG